MSAGTTCVCFAKQAAASRAPDANSAPSVRPRSASAKPPIVRLDRDARAARQQIVEVKRALVGRRVERLDAQVAIGSVEALGEIGPVGDLREQFESQRSVAVEQALDALFAEPDLARQFYTTCAAVRKTLRTD